MLGISARIEESILKYKIINNQTLSPKFFPPKHRTQNPEPRTQLLSSVFGQFIYVIINHEIIYGLDFYTSNI